MEELHEVTRQYLSCPDPVEAAARRQRVHFSDVNGLMEATAASILTTAATKANQRYPPLQIRDCDSNPVTPPPLNEAPCNDWLFPDPSTILSPVNGIEADDGLKHFSKETSPTVETTPISAKERAARVRSIIVSPNSEAQENFLRPQEPIVEPEGDTAMRTIQKKTKRKTRKPLKLRSPRISPSILRGARSKKRNLAQLQSSPGTKGGISERKTSRKQARMITKDDAGPSHPTANPPIQLIPAMSKKKADFRPLPDQAP